MKLFYQFSIFFIYFSVVSINPHASSNNYINDSPRFLQVPQGSPDFSNNGGTPFLGWDGLGGLKFSQKPDVIVAQDGKGNFNRIMDAIAAAPSNSPNHYVILVKRGVYNEYVNIDKTKSNLVIVGEGMDATTISGSRSVGGGRQTFDTATFAVNADGFVAIDIGFENTAGEAMNQAVALLSGGDKSAFYRCKITGNQDTLLVVSGRQFYRECKIIGTVDFIFGYGAAVFQYSTIYVKKAQGGTNVITAHGRNSSTLSTGFSFQFCKIAGDADASVKDQQIEQGAYLGRNWGYYAATVFMKSSMSIKIRPEGWLQYHGVPVDNVYFGEYLNTGAGAGTSGRVKWPGYHMMSASDADKFTVSKFIDGDSWLPPLGIPHTEQQKI